MALALTGLSGLSGVMTAGGTPDPGTGQSYWFNGLVGDDLHIVGAVTGGMVNWRDGLVSDILATT